MKRWLCLDLAIHSKDNYSSLSSPLDRLVGLNKYKDHGDVRSGKVAWGKENT